MAQHSELVKSLFDSKPPCGFAVPHKPRKRGTDKRDYTPLSWEAYFDKKIALKLPNERGTVNAYTKGSHGILFLLLHGGGYSSLTWSCFVQSLTGLLNCQVLALDSRGHGDTCIENETDMSIDALSLDVRDALDVYLQQKSSDSETGIIAIGHSMGGAVAVHAASCGYIPGLLGLAVIDVVEGSALEALQSMQSFLHSRPQSFASLQEAIQWCIRSGQVRNLESARISMPSQVREIQQPCTAPSNTILEEDDNNAGGEETMDHPNDVQRSYIWRIDLSKTEPYWSGWFTGLSNKFLSVPAAKLLILAGVDRLDRDLTIGQMQGKFHMIVLPKVGHAIHEDSPEKLADVLATFCVRNKFAEATAGFTPVFPGC